MNIVLSCYANKGLASCVLEKGGRVVSKEVFQVNKEEKVHLKEYIFESIIKGLKHARKVVEHEDLLLIGVQNVHVAEWLNGQKEYKGYESYLDRISDILETLDCRYLFSNTGAKKAKNILKEGVPEEKLERATDIFKDM